MQDLKTIALSMLLAFVATALQAGNYTYQSGECVAFAWDDVDRPCVYTTDNDRIVMWVQSIAADKHTISMTGYGWALASDNQYYLYYPYSPNYVINGNHHTALPIAYTGQTQQGNNSTTHLAPYDYMTAQATSTTTDCHFNLQHLGAMLRIACLMPEDATIHDIILTSLNGKVFTASATMNVTDNTVTPVQQGDSLTLFMENTTVSAGDSLIAYMMIEPSLLAGKTIRVNVETTGSSYIARFLLPDVKPGICYLLNGKATAKPALGLNAKSPALAVNKAKDVMSSTEDMPTAAITSPTATATDFALNAESRYIAPLAGDANSDGKVSVADGNITINYALNHCTTGIDLDNADMNMDGNITTVDAIAIVNHYLNKELSK